MRHEAAALRRRNEDRCERILEREAPLELDDLDWSAVGSVPVDEGTLGCLRYMRDVEGFTDRDPVGLAAHRTTMADPLIARFIVRWRREEAGHTEALGRYLAAYGAATGTDVAPRQLPPPAVAAPVERVLSRISGPVGTVVAAAHMTWGAANELLTLNGYRMLAGRTADPVLSTLLSRIADQETKHYSFYFLQAEWRLAASPLARRVLPRLMQGTWTPVGVGDGYKPQEEYDRVLAYLTSTPSAPRILERMDRRFSSLPGLGSLRIYGGSLP